MEVFKYYKRGEGELDTSNFPEILKQGAIAVDVLDEKTFVSLLALNQYLSYKGIFNFVTTVKGYVQHMRGDKDVFPVSKLYPLLNHMTLNLRQIQHESTPKVKSGPISKGYIAGDLEIYAGHTLFIGADSSVPKFFPEVSCVAYKVRKEGKVTGMQFDVRNLEGHDNITIVDDILGGGATVQMLVDLIRGSGYDKDINLWVQYNEDIHSEDFLKQFSKIYIGDTI